MVQMTETSACKVYLAPCAQNASTFGAITYYIITMIMKNCQMQRRWRRAENGGGKHFHRLCTSYAMLGCGCSVFFPPVAT